MTPENEAALADADHCAQLFAGGPDSLQKRMEAHVRRLVAENERLRAAIVPADPCGDGDLDAYYRFGWNAAMKRIAAALEGKS